MATLPQPLKERIERYKRIAKNLRNTAERCRESKRIGEQAMADGYERLAEKMDGMLTEAKAEAQEERTPRQQSRPRVKLDRRF